MSASWINVLFGWPSLFSHKVEGDDDDDDDDNWHMAWTDRDRGVRVCV